MPPPILPLHVQDAELDEKGEPLKPEQQQPLSPRALQLDEVIAQLGQANHDATHLDGGGHDEDTDCSKASEPGLWNTVLHYRAKLRHFLHIPAFHYTIICMVLTDLLVVFVELILALLNLPCYTELQKLQFEEVGVPPEKLPNPSGCQLQQSPSLEHGETALWAISVTLLSIFVIELFLSGVAFGFWRHFSKPIFFIDAIIVTTSLILEIYFKYGASGAGLHSAPSTIIVLRLWKIVRAVHAIAHSIELKNQSQIKQLKRARDQLEGAYQKAVGLLKEQYLQIAYLKSKATDVTDEELGEYVKEALVNLNLQRVKGTEARKLEKVEQMGSADMKKETA